MTLGCLWNFYCDINIFSCLFIIIARRLYDTGVLAGFLMHPYCKLFAVVYPNQCIKFCYDLL